MCSLSHTPVLPGSQSAGPDAPRRRSSAVINSLTLCVKNSNPTRSLLSSSLPVSRFRTEPSLSLRILGLMPALWLSVVVSFSLHFPHSSLFLIPSCPLSSLVLSPLHSTMVTSFYGAILGGCVCVFGPRSHVLLQKHTGLLISGSIESVHSITLPL